MRKFICFVLVALSVIGATGCGFRFPNVVAPDRRIEPTNSPVATVPREPEPGARAEEIPEPSLKSEPQVVKYPGRIDYDQTWHSETSDGYLVREKFSTWEPYESTEAFEHPLDGQEIPMYGEGIWVIPFLLELTNETTGFGSAKVNFSVGLCHVESQTRVGDVFANWMPTTPWLDEADYQRSGSFYTKTAIFRDGMPSVSAPLVWRVWDGQEIGEGKTMRLIGFFIFVDSVRTPNLPTGATAEMLGGVSERGTNRHFDGYMIVAGTVHMGMPAVNFARPIASVTKDVYGDLVLDWRVEWR